MKPGPRIFILLLICSHLFTVMLIRIFQQNLSVTHTSIHLSQHSAQRSDEAAEWELRETVCLSVRERDTAGLVNVLWIHPPAREKLLFGRNKSESRFSVFCLCYCQLWKRSRACPAVFYRLSVIVIVIWSVSFKQEGGGPNIWVSSSVITGNHDFVSES